MRVVLPQRLRVATVGLLLATVACKQTIEVPVVSPEGPQSDLPTYARFQLSKSIYDPAKQIKKLPEPKVVVSPPAPFRVEISSPYTVDVNLGALALATDYTVTLKEGLTTIDGSAATKADASAHFRTPLNRLTAISELAPGVNNPGTISFPETGEPSGQLPPFGPQSQLRFEFQYDVSEEQAGHLIKVYAQDGTAIATKLADEQTFPTSSFILAPTAAWPRSTPLAVTVDKGFKVAQPDAGPLGSESGRTVKARTWAAQEVVAGPIAKAGS
jgi:hypothetical protein